MIRKPRQYFNEVVLAYDGDECLIWPFGKSIHGYGRLMYGGKARIVSRLVCEDTHGLPPTPKHQAAHSCGKGHLGCVARRHLSWKTNAENSADRLLHGTDQLGERNHQAKLTEADVRAIRALKGEMHWSEVASEFGISKRTVHGIQSGSSWAWVGQ